MTKTIESRSGVAKEPAGEERAPLTGFPAVLTVTAVGAAILVVGHVDRATGLAPDLTIAYIAPLLAATYLLGRPAGLSASVAAVMVE